MTRCCCRWIFTEGGHWPILTIRPLCAIRLYNNGRCDEYTTDCSLSPVCCVHSTHQQVFNNGWWSNIFKHVLMGFNHISQPSIQTFIFLGFPWHPLLTHHHSPWGPAPLGVKLRNVCGKHQPTLALSEFLQVSVSVSPWDIRERPRSCRMSGGGSPGQPRALVTVHQIPRGTRYPSHPATDSLILGWSG